MAGPVGLMAAVDTAIGADTAASGEVMAIAQAMPIEAVRFAAMPEAGYAVVAVSTAEVPSTAVAASMVAEADSTVAAAFMVEATEAVTGKAIRVV
jgi:hypothetical protein